MSPEIISSNAGEHETATVEWLIRYAHRECEAIGLVQSPARVSKFVRRAFKQAGPTWARYVIDAHIQGLTESPTFDADLTSSLTYADPTGNAAARAVDIERAREAHDHG